MRRTLTGLLLAAVLTTLVGCGFPEFDEPDEPMAPWRAASAEPPDPAATSIDILVSERGCSGGAPVTDRIQPPEVDYLPDRIVVVIRIARVDGLSRCPDMPATPYRLELAEPVGDRPLVDGSHLPPPRSVMPPPTHNP
ncbi:hypothetical protein [Catellatospora paridis]|uniref:hypothetical protein n=1 Tax=Catellatospora paridis TaxID=1617086 RepID=UPI0012D3C3BD|nr:hypothetical protein [Catellatospora paridis]